MNASYGMVWFHSMFIGEVLLNMEPTIPIGFNKNAFYSIRKTFEVFLWYSYD